MPEQNPFQNDESDKQQSQRRHRTRNMVLVGSGVLAVSAAIALSAYLYSDQSNSPSITNCDISDLPSYYDPANVAPVDIQDLRFAHNPSNRIRLQFNLGQAKNSTNLHWLSGGGVDAYNVSKDNGIGQTMHVEVSTVQDGHNYNQPVSATITPPAERVGDNIAVFVGKSETTTPCTVVTNGKSAPGHVEVEQLAVQLADEPGKGWTAVSPTIPVDQLKAVLFVPDK